MVDREYQSSSSRRQQLDQGLDDRTLLRFAVWLGLVVPIGLALVAIGSLMIVGQSD